MSSPIFLIPFTSRDYAGIQNGPINGLAPALYIPSTFEHYAASVIHEWQETEDKRLKMVNDTLRTLGLTGHVGTKKIGDVGIELQVGRLLGDKTDNTEMVNIADVGFGVSQVLPVLVALIAAEPGRLVYLEQPELHLHPPRTSRIGASAGRRGKTWCPRRC